MDRRGPQQGTPQTEVCLDVLIVDVNHRDGAAQRIDGNDGAGLEIVSDGGWVDPYARGAYLLGCRVQEDQSVPQAGGDNINLVDRIENNSGGLIRTIVAALDSRRTAGNIKKRDLVGGSIGHGCSEADGVNGDSDRAASNAN